MLINLTQYIFYSIGYFSPLNVYFHHLNIMLILQLLPSNFLIFSFKFDTMRIIFYFVNLHIYHLVSLFLLKEWFFHFGVYY